MEVLVGSFLVMMGLLLSPTLVRAARQLLVSDQLRDRRVRRLVQHTASALVAEAEGRVRVSGTVRILEPVAGYPELAAFFTRTKNTELVWAENQHGHRYKAPRTERRERTAAGRFVVDDGSGTALVEDPNPFVWYLGQAPFVPNGSGALEVSEGTRVTVVGWAEPLAAPSGRVHRDRPSVRLRGDRRERLVVLVECDPG